MNGIELGRDDVKRQSLAAWNTWRSKWIVNCAANKDAPTRVPLSKYLGDCKDRILVNAAFGHSLEKNLETMKARRGEYKLFCCDKAYGLLCERGIVPDYCLVVDASVSTSWIKGQDTSRTVLFANVAANKEFVAAWKGPVALYVNWDNIGTAHILGKVADCYDLIPAGSNVSNGQILLATQIFGAKATLLVGFDYSWRDGGNYYACSDSPKRNWMHHLDLVSPYGGLVQTSSNLAFSCAWMTQFFQKHWTVGERTVNCCEEGILDLRHKMPLDLALNRYREAVCQ